MFAEQTDNEINVGKKGRLRRLIGIVGCFILLILVILVIAKVWLVPGIIRREVKKVLSKFCDGSVEIESVEANLNLSASSRMHLAFVVASSVGNKIGQPVERFHSHLLMKG